MTYICWCLLFLLHIVTCNHLILPILLADNGKVIKAVNADSADTMKKVTPVVIEEIQVFPHNVSIRTLKVVRDSRNVQDGRLIVVSDHEVQALKLQRCYSDKILSCRFVITSF